MIPPEPSKVRIGVPTIVITDRDGAVVSRTRCVDPESVSLQPGETFEFVSPPAPAPREE